jgi:hypothetical protein
MNEISQIHCFFIDLPFTVTFLIYIIAAHLELIVMFTLFSLLAGKFTGNYAWWLKICSDDSSKAELREPVTKHFPTCQSRDFPVVCREPGKLPTGFRGHWGATTGATIGEEIYYSIAW